MTTIAVICPTYNSATYIEKTLQCLWEQTALPTQIIFSDDGSVDQTVSIIENWKNKFEEMGIVFKVIKNNHSGPGAARNYGVAESNSEWLAFLDADDIWNQDKIKRIKEEIEQNPLSNFFLHWEKYIKSDGTEMILKHGKDYDETVSLGRQLYWNNFFSTSASVCKRKILEEVHGFDNSFPNGQDYELWLRMSPYIRLKIMPEVLGSYIELPQSITARPYWQRYFSLLIILSRHRDKGGIIFFAYRVLRATFSRMWISSLMNFLRGVRGH